MASWEQRLVNRFVGEIERAIGERALISDGRSVLVAVSGGVDSVVLLDALRRLAGRHRWKLAVAHFNHQLRGRKSAGDERFVRALARRCGVPFLVARSDVRRHAAERGISLEMAARAERHAFLVAAAKEHGARVVALGHHADDQVELFLWRLLRGAGSEGLGGMRWLAPSPARRTIALVRPLLGTTRAAIDAYARAWSLRFRHDDSNDSNDILRNRIRHELIPLLKRNYQPGLLEVILRQAVLLGAEADHLREEARRWLRSRRPAFGMLPAVLQRRVLLEQLIEQGAIPEFDKIEALRRAPNIPVQFAVGKVLERTEAGKLRARRAK